MRQGSIIGRLAALEMANHAAKPFNIALAWDNDVKLDATRRCHLSEHGPACVVEESSGRHVIRLVWE